MADGVTMWPIFVSGLVAGFFNGLRIWAKGRSEGDDPDLDEALRRSAKEALRSAGSSGVNSLRDLLQIDPTILPTSVREALAPCSFARAAEAHRRAEN